VISRERSIDVAIAQQHVSTTTAAIAAVRLVTRGTLVVVSVAASAAARAHARAVDSGLDGHVPIAVHAQRDPVGALERQSQTQQENGE